MNTTRHSVVIARPGYTTIALGPYSIRGFADLVASNLRHHLRNQPDTQIDVEPHDETLTHLPPLLTTPQGLAQHLAADEGTTDRLDVHARLAAQIGPREALPLMAEAHMRRANELWASAA